MVFHLGGGIQEAIFVGGAAAEVLADTEWQVSFLAGHARTDFIESLYKIKLGQRLSNPKLRKTQKF
jgi:hypothetical protein